MSEEREDYIAYRLKKSNDVYNDALLLATNSRWNSCVNRLYYSAFYLVSALLYQQGAKAGSHNGIKVQFFQHFVKTNIVDIESGKLYAHLFDWRQESDYADFVEFDEATVMPLIEKVSKFNSLIKELIEKAK